MITNKGKRLLTNYVLGMTKSFATHIAIGCGAEPLSDAAPTQPVENANRENLVFEMVRIPIISRGIVYENGVRKVAMKAELPVEGRYKITEIGVYSGARNMRAAQSDSKTLTSFNAPGESWFMQAGSSASAIPIVTVPLTASPAFDGNISAAPVSSVYNDNEIWTRYGDRQARLEPPRFLGSSIVVRGNWTNLTYNGSTWASGNTNSIETSTIGANMSKNSGNDEVRLAFSMAASTLTNNLLPDRVNIWVEFVNNFSSDSKKYAVAKKSLLAADFNDNYHVLTIKLSEFIEDSGFSWAAVNGIRLRASAQVGSAVSGNWYIVFDGMRLENVSTENPLNGLLYYSQVTTPDGYPALKTESTNNFIEFRTEFDLG